MVVFKADQEVPGMIVSPKITDPLVAKRNSNRVG